MSVNFSTITPMSQNTISKPPAYAATGTQQPQASSPMTSGQPKQKKSHWFRNTLITAVVLGAGAALGAKYAPKIFDSKATLAAGAKWHEQGLHYAKKYIGVAGEFINSNITKGVDWAKKLFASKKTGGTP